MDKKQLVISLMRTTNMLEEVIEELTTPDDTLSFDQNSAEYWKAKADEYKNDLQKVAVRYYKMGLEAGKLKTRIFPVNNSANLRFEPDRDKIPLYKTVACPGTVAGLKVPC